MIKKLFRYLLPIVLVGLLLIFLFFLGIYLGVFGHLYNKEELKSFKNETASLVMSEDGKIIGKFFSENRTNIQYEQLPDHLINALLATEDVRFFEHEGIDSRSLLRVLFKSILLQKESAGGGSTITQQLAKNMYGRASFGPLTTPINKFKEIILANRLEHVYSKEDILELYLNTIPFGEDVYGVESAAQRYFNKEVHNLSTEESAVLVGMLKANTFYNPRKNPENAMRRRNVVLNQMQKYDFLDEREVDSLRSLPLNLNYENLRTNGLANYFVEVVRHDLKDIMEEINLKNDANYDLYKSGLIIETTLNLELQKYALKSFKTHLKRMQELIDKQYRSGSSKKKLNSLVENRTQNIGKNRDLNSLKNREMFSWDGFYADSLSIRDSIQRELTILHAGLIGLNPKTGAVKTWVGGIDFRRYPYDQIYAQRQVASTFKPIIYATALENGIQPCQYISNDSIVLKDYDNWSPQNYDKSAGGKYSVAAALAKSMNIPTVHLFLGLPFEKIHQTWVDLGFSQPLETNPSVALGTASASIYELARAYATFANEGKLIEPFSVVSVKTSEGKVLYERKREQSEKVVLSEDATEILNAILQKAINEGTGQAIRSRYNIQMDLAGKTGTSQDYADAWFAAYNPNLVLVTRVGCEVPAIHFNSGSIGSGSALALPIVGLTLNQVEKSQQLRKKFNEKFPEKSMELMDMMDCDDFKEETGVEKFFDDLFGKSEMTSEEAGKKAAKKNKKKESFFKRLFKKKD